MLKFPYTHIETPKKECVLKKYLGLVLNFFRISICCPAPPPFLHQVPSFENSDLSSQLLEILVSLLIRVFWKTSQALRMFSGRPDFFFMFYESTLLKNGTGLYYGPWNPNQHRFWLQNFDKSTNENQKSKLSDVPELWNIKLQIYFLTIDLRRNSSETIKIFNNWHQK